ncbi:MAG: sigma factor-like helix-turn-helix DNA-binding protein [Caldicoprobacterales bacterium]|jgi:predicted DNA-binding protein YlxM (UPF0122 family)
MEKFAQIGMLLEIYGGLLTHRQRDVMDLYYNYDLSLSEIAEQFDISRQGVHDLIKRSEQILLKADQSVGVLKLRDRLWNRIRDIEQDLDSIIDDFYEECKANPDKIKEKIKLVKKKVHDLGSL